MAYLSTLDERYGGTFLSGTAGQRDAPYSTITNFTLAEGYLNPAYGALIPINYSTDGDVYSLGILSPGYYSIYASGYNWDFSNSIFGITTPTIEVYGSIGNLLGTSYLGSASLTVVSSDTFYVAVKGTSYSSSEYQLYYTYDRALNTPPVAQDRILTIYEDGIFSFNANDFGYYDADGNSLSSVVITMLESMGSLKYNGFDVTLNQVIPVVGINAGLLTYAPAPNTNGFSYTNFGFKVSDGVSLSNIAYSMTVNVTAVNDAPTGSVSITGTATQGQTLTAANTLADADGLGTISHQWKANGNSIAGATNATYTLTQGEVGKTITVTASYTDGQGTTESVSSSATSAVANINDTPTGSVSITGTATQGQTLAAANTLADADGLGTISYLWKANGESIAGATNASYTLTQGEVGKTITVTARYIDGLGGNESVTSPATAVVANVNDDPSLAAPASINLIDTVADDNFTQTAGTLSAADGDGDALSYGLSSGTDNGATVSKTGSYGTLTVTKATGAYVFFPNDTAIEGLHSNAAESFTITVSDGAASVNANLVINLTGANDVPVADNPSGNTSENTVLTGILSATDRDNPVLTFSQATNPSHGKVTVNTNGIYNYTPEANYYGADSFTFTVKDSSNATDTGTVSLTVGAVNNAPTISSIPALTFTDSAAQDVFNLEYVGQIQAQDPDSSNLTYGLVGGQIVAVDTYYEVTGNTGGLHGGMYATHQGTYGTLYVDTSTGAYTFYPNSLAIEARKAVASETFAVTVSDGELSSQTPLTISITGANDTPVLAQSIADQAATTGTAFNLTLPIGTFSDADGDTLAYSAKLSNGNVLPAWLTFNPTSHTFSGPPTDTGSLSIVVTASDGELSATDTFTLAIDDIPNPVDGTQGNDNLPNSMGNDVIEGGTGTDQVIYQQRAAAYTVGGNGSSRSVRGSEGNDTLHDVERVIFDDANVAFDLDGNAGQVYRLYKAAFARTPDLGGLGGWIKAMDDGTTIEQVANAFVGSTEFQNLYGANSSNNAFVMALYLNALGRAPASSEIPYWANQLATGSITRAQMLAQFSESTENKNAVSSLIAAGITYAANAEQATTASHGLTLNGTENADTLYGSVGRDILTGLGGNDTLNGGANVDTAVYAGPSSEYVIAPIVYVQQGDPGYTVTGEPGGVDTVFNVERFQFSDKVLAFDTDGNAGQVFRLYQAAFHRTPDKAGLTDWVRGADQGMTLQNIAKAFIASQEFQKLYGANPSNDAFVTALYQNAIGRAPDADGKAYWTTQLDNGLTKEMALIGFSESTENQAAVIGVIHNGIELSLG